VSPLSLRLRRVKRMREPSHVLLFSERAAAKMADVESKIMRYTSCVIFATIAVNLLGFKLYFNVHLYTFIM